jgi:Ca2+/H+ antiporter, TMEM165/GDT1 family
MVTAMALTPTANSNEARRELPFRDIMDWKLFFSTFAAIFVAELGDKTQLAALSFSAGSKSKWLVFAASSLALVTSSALAVALGEGVSRFVSPLWLRRIAGVVFIAMGVLFLIRKPE